jgi:hypothetical protein
MLVIIVLFSLLWHSLQAGCDAYVRNAPPDSRRYPCIFPFKMGNNRTYDNECAFIEPNYICPIDLDPPRRRLVREGICECGVGGMLFFLFLHARFRIRLRYCGFIFIARSSSSSHS